MKTHIGLIQRKGLKLVNSFNLEKNHYNIWSNITFIKKTNQEYDLTKNKEQIHLTIYELISSKEVEELILSTISKLSSYSIHFIKLLPTIDFIFSYSSNWDDSLSSGKLMSNKFASHSSNLAHVDYADMIKGKYIISFNIEALTRLLSNSTNILETFKTNVTTVIAHELSHLIDQIISKVNSHAQFHKRMKKIKQEKSNLFRKKEDPKFSNKVFYSFRSKIENIKIALYSEGFAMFFEEFIFGEKTPEQIYANAQDHIRSYLALTNFNYDISKKPKVGEFLVLGGEPSLIHAMEYTLKHPEEANSDELRYTEEQLFRSLLSTTYKLGPYIIYELFTHGYSIEEISKLGYTKVLGIYKNIARKENKILFPNNDVTMIGVIGKMNQLRKKYS